MLSLGSMKKPAGAGDPDHRGIGRVLKARAADAGRRCGRRRGALLPPERDRSSPCALPMPLITLIRGLLLPMTYFLAAAATADAMRPRHGLGTVAKAASRVVTWLLTGSLVLFTGYLTLSGAVSTSADALTVQVTRSAVGAMPVVGRILSDAAGSVLAGAGVVKNAIGVFGLLGGAGGVSGTLCTSGGAVSFV